jgi:hypothetical protein
MGVTFGKRWVSPSAEYYQELKLAFGIQDKCQALGTQMAQGWSA